ncbi:MULTISPECIES: hypothetical protein [Mesorhizobium]|uniref:hypothetical protein n=1 Tax=Mesorhizobium TaxID=68287 RepID=UPI0007A9598A|nr:MULTISPECIES: hypothetical protein [Mesorhizobium]AMX93725.1 hypothetical protein A4R28_11735 [Mesorhizobium ciceri]MDF3208424.1 hypothetical protein [Mesorhizobium sp. LMG15046]MDF3229005.1 hypothetical protein [Mesorhizobium sp. DSM 30133]RUU22122.1 hypothetical protein EOC84_03155 [Mesorhizobium sp. Primo-B]RUU37968.1 hypothetical protein EOC83_17060 [Mesorhizobium sp. Primo-A]
MTNAFAMNGICRPAGAVTATSGLLRSDSFSAVSENRGSDNSGAACVGSRAFYSVGRLAIAVAISFGLHQPVGAAIRP